MSTRRIVSTIPRGETLTPAPVHQAQTTPTQQETNVPTPDPNDPAWVYPSEQQFYNAMKRKGYQPDAQSMHTVVSIHNAVNERTWSLVQKWEATLHDCPNPRLVRFLGRPDDRSPRALFNEYVLMKSPPFDRHDWVVDRGDGVERRYVIDFYDGNPQTGGFTGSQKSKKPVSMHLDVRPALDDPMAAVDRVRMGFREMLPGIFGELDELQKNNKSLGRKMTMLQPKAAASAAASDKAYADCTKTRS
uniref:Holocytochrome c-type synthase n=1 Tax=Proboscia inermis TaxID=420281 RepID=A0A7S0C270_9STRA